MRVGVSARGGVFGSAGAARLHEDVVLAGEGDGAQGDDQEEVRDEGLDTLALQHLALAAVARLVDHLLQEVRELLDDGDGLAAGEAHAVHWGRGVEARLAESGWSLEAGSALTSGNVVLSSLPPRSGLRQVGVKQHPPSVLGIHETSPEASHGPASPPLPDTKDVSEMALHLLVRIPLTLGPGTVPGVSEGVTGEISQAPAPDSRAGASIFTVSTAIAAH